MSLLFSLQCKLTLIAIPTLMDHNAVSVCYFRSLVRILECAESSFHMFVLIGFTIEKMHKINQAPISFTLACGNSFSTNNHCSPDLAGYQGFLGTKFTLRSDRVFLVDPDFRRSFFLQHRLGASRSIVRRSSQWVRRNYGETGQLPREKRVLDRRDIPARYPYQYFLNFMRFSEHFVKLYVGASQGFATCVESWTHTWSWWGWQGRRTGKICTKIWMVPN